MVDTATPTLEEIYLSFTGGKPDMESKQFAKLNKDCGLYTKKYNSGVADIVFSKVRTKNSKVISFDQFESAVKLIAVERKSDEDAVKALIIEKGSATYSGTKADAVKLHDDKSTYTGVYAQGGPTTVDVGKGQISDISQLCDRTAANVRGVKK